LAQSHHRDKTHTNHGDDRSLHHHAIRGPLHHPINSPTPAKPSDRSTVPSRKCCGSKIPSASAEKPREAHGRPTSSLPFHSLPSIIHHSSYSTYDSSASSKTFQSWDPRGSWLVSCRW
jgi:hypothetical protein